MKNEILKKLINIAVKAYENAHAPYSKFRVGSAVLDENGNMYAGCNVENAAYPSGSCAEEQAIGNMVVNGGRVIKEMVIIGKSKDLITPCGACRQRIRELCDKDVKIHICDIDSGLRETFTITELLPCSFGPQNL